jgi:hypothetical protein
VLELLELLELLGQVSCEENETYHFLGSAVHFEPTIYGLVVAGSGKELYGFVVRILTAVRVLTVGAFQNRSLRIVYFSLLLCWPIINLAVTVAVTVAITIALALADRTRWNRRVIYFILSYKDRFIYILLNYQSTTRS